MDTFKQQIQQSLFANIIIDKCSRSEYLIFRDAWCTQNRVIRFTTHFFRKYFPLKDSESGKWKTGDFAMYEATISADSFVVRCVLSFNAFDQVMIDRKEKLMNVLGLNESRTSEDIILKTWDLTQKDEDANMLLDSFETLIKKEIPNFEQTLIEGLDAGRAAPDELHEGTAEYVWLSKYERNQKARSACIAAHGPTCSVCGMDFGKAYGPAFEGIIEVHHIVPLSEIGKDYIVDPIKDLVPLCPNCHTLIHSKKDGVYTLEELKALMQKHL